ncbi:hypothetical protein N9003_00605 [bacterium]|nr:hypothetical protein [bacterium]
MFNMVGDKLVELREQQYDSEAVLQDLLANHPDLMMGGQIAPDSPRRWLLIKQEIGIPQELDKGNQIFLDHLFIDQDAIPTFVEVKRSTDTRIRREVVGQMLDYAANAVVYWPMETMRAEFESNCKIAGVAPEEKLAEFLGPERDQGEFWQTAKANLQRGKIRLLFIADVIPSKLLRIIEFLNEQMDPAEVLGIEIKQYVGEEIKTLVPRVVGQTTVAVNRKGAQSNSEKKAWDSAQFFQDLSASTGKDECEIARHIVNWAKSDIRPLGLSWPITAKIGRVEIALDDSLEGQVLCSLDTRGRVGIPFGTMMNTSGIFSDRSSREQLLKQLNDIDGIDFPLEKVDLWPSFELNLLQDEVGLSEFITALSWAADHAVSGA